MNFDIGFVIPLESEATPLISLLTYIQKKIYGTREIITGKFNNKEICIIISGCGKIKSASATQFLISTFPAKQYVHYGTAGALDINLKIGDIIIPNEVVEHDVKELFPQKMPAPIHLIKSAEAFLKMNKKKLSRQIFIGRILSGDEDIVSIRRKTALFKKYKGLSVDWESAGFILTCNLNNTPGIVMRVISDYAYEYTHEEYAINKDEIINNLLPAIQIVMSYDNSENVS